MQVFGGLLILAIPIATALVAAPGPGSIVRTDSLDESTWADGAPPDAAVTPASAAAPSELAVPPRPIRVVGEAAARFEADHADDAASRKRRLLAVLARRYPNVIERLRWLRGLVEQADIAYRRGDFGMARVHAIALEQESPQVGVAERLMRLLAERACRTADADGVRRIDARWADCCEQVLDATLRPAEVVESSKRRSMVGPEAFDERERNAAILAKLESTRVRGIQFQDQNLDQIVTYLGRASGLTFCLSPEVRRTRLREVNVNIPGLDDVSFDWLLTNVVTRPFELEWDVVDEVVTIGTWAEIKLPGLRLKYFDVRDFCRKIQLYGETDEHDRYRAPGAYIPANDPDVMEPATRFLGDDLIDTIVFVVAPGSWGRAGTSIDVKNGTLIVKHVDAALEAVGELLSDLRSLPIRPEDFPKSRTPTTVYTITWGVVELVGRASADGAVVRPPVDTPAAPFAPGALLAAVRAQVNEPAWLACYGSIGLTDGTLSVRGDYKTVAGVDRLIGEWKARVRVCDSATDEWDVEIR